MRAYVLLLVVALFNAFAAGSLSYEFTRASPAEVDPPENGEALKERFTSTHEPQLTIDLPTLFPPGAGTELLDPAEVLPQTSHFPAAHLRALVRYAETCDSALAPSTLDGTLSKALVWHRAQCGHAELPPGFFESRPFMHPGGSSYAALAAEKQGVAWVRDNHPLFHALEWKTLTALSPPRELLASLPARTLSALAASRSLLLTNDVVLIAQQRARRDAPPSTYSQYTREAWDAFFSKTSLQPRPLRLGQACVVIEDEVCWAKNQAPYFARLSRWTLALLALALASAFAAGLLLLRRAGAQRRDDDRQRFMLQTLAHELRTPVSSLLLTLESLRRGFDGLDEEAQRSLLRAVDDAQRLRRLAERSRAYLQPAPGGQLFALHRVQVDSFVELVEQALEPFRDSITIRATSDGAGWVDPYWLGTCLKNLVENALTHGAPPVEVIIAQTGSTLEVSVLDGGARSLQQTSQSAGMGLGLSIVRRAMQAMGGSLDITERPTRFSLRLPLGSQP